MANEKVGVPEEIPTDFQNKLTDYLNEDSDVAPNLPVETVVEPIIEPQKDPVIEEIVIEDEPIDNPVIVETTEVPEITLELDDEPIDNNWDSFAQETGLEVKGKEAIVNTVKSLRDENAKLKAEYQKFQDLSAVSEQVNALNGILKMEGEDLLRFKYKEIMKMTPEDIEAEIQDHVDNNTLNSAARAVKYEVISERDKITQNASAIRQQQESEQRTNAAAFQKTAIDKVKSISNIYGLSFSPENLQKVHGRAERLLVSKEFQDKLKNPEYVAELAFREATGSSLVKMLENKFKNQAKNDLIRDFGQPNQPKAAGVERPKHIEQMSDKDPLTEFVNDTEDKGTVGR